MGKVLKVGWVVIMLGLVLSASAQAVPDEQQLPDKNKVSKDLVVLRDSLNNTISRLSQQETNAADPMRPAYLKMTQDLTRHKIQLDRAIEDVVNSEWNADVRTRVSHTIEDVRIDYKRVLSELNQQPKPE